MKTWTEEINSGNMEEITAEIERTIDKTLAQLHGKGFITDAMMCKLYGMRDDVRQESFLSCMEGTEEQAERRIDKGVNAALNRMMRRLYKHGKTLSIDAENENGDALGDTIGTDGMQAETETKTAILQAIKATAETTADEKALYMLIFKQYSMREAASAAGVSKQRMETLKSRIRKELE